MCGIYVYLVRCPHDRMNEHTIPASTWQSLLQRGPDYHSVICLESFSEWKFLFAGTVLWMQGEVPGKQPLIDDSSNALLWNGDIFEGPLVPEGNTSDTASLLEALNTSADYNQSLLDVLASVRGPFTFVYWNSSSQKMWFGRDRLGRHSLLWHMKDSEQLALTSVGEKGTAYDEVPAIGIFMISFTNSGERNLVLFPWTDVPEDSIALAQANSAVPFSIEISRIPSPINLYKRLTNSEPPEQYVAIMSGCRKSSMTCDIFMNLLCHKFIQNRVEELICKLKQSVKVRCKTQPGICSDCLSVKCHHTEATRCVPDDQNASKIRCVGVCNKCYSDLLNRKDTPICNHPKVGVLFSGGLDSTVIAALTHEFVPLEEPIDLLNVAFDRTRDNIQSRTARRENDFSVPGVDFNVPDRQTGLQSYEELKRIFPNRQWNFVKIDVGKDELEHYRTKTIADLIHPLNTVLDDSLGCALWFASRRQGIVNDVLYKSPVRILLLGMGADEQLGGYSRHRNLLSNGGWQALSDGLWLDVARISSRNLGRDDRVLSSHGCQGRFPFLDEEVISYLCSLPPWERCYPTPDFPPGTGDKLLLRLTAWNLGLQKAASFPKRAFQFGSRIAKSKEKGSDVSSRLQD